MTIHQKMKKTSKYWLKVNKYKQRREQLLQLNKSLRKSHQVKMTLMMIHLLMKKIRKKLLKVRKLHPMETLNKDLARQVRSNRKLHQIVMRMTVVKMRSPQLKVAESNLMSPLVIKKALLLRRPKMMMKRWMVMRMLQM